MTPEPSTHSSESDAHQRAIWCSIGGHLLKGRMQSEPPAERVWWRRILGAKQHRGTVFEFEPVDLPEAKRCLEAFLTNPGEFGVCTAAGARIDVLASRTEVTVTLDCWFESADGPDTAVIRDSDASELLTCIFQTGSDEAVVQCIRRLEHAAARR